MFGEKYAEAYSKGIKNRIKLESINLNSNRLTDIGFSKILQNAPQNLLILDISYNFNLGIDTYKLIAEYLEDEKSILQQLLIEGNQIGDKSVKLIWKSLQYNNNLKFLNISRNNVTDVGAREISIMLLINNKLNVLFMHWNKVREEGGQKIAKSVLAPTPHPPPRGGGEGVGVEKFSAYPHPHLLKIVKSNYNRKLKKKLFDLDNTFVSNFHLFILLLQNFTWHFKFFNFHNAIIKSLFGYCSFDTVNLFSFPFSSF